MANGQHFNNFMTGIGGISDLIGKIGDTSGTIKDNVQNIQLPTVQTNVGLSPQTMIYLGAGLLAVLLIFKRK